MIDATTPFECFRGRRLRAIQHIVVQVGADAFTLPDTAVFVFDDGLVQVLVEVHEKRVRLMAGPEDFVIEGDYEDRTGCGVAPWELTFEPFVVSGLYGVWEEADAGAEYLVGLFLADEEGLLSLGLILHTDDLECGAADGLLRYIGAILPSARRLSIREVSATGTAA